MEAQSSELQFQQEGLRAPPRGRCGQWAMTLKEEAELRLELT